jgi:PAS domain S-box-containing protein
MLHSIEKITIRKIATSRFEDQVETMAKIGSWTIDFEKIESRWSLNSFNLHGLDHDKEWSWSEVFNGYEESTKTRFNNLINQMMIDHHPISIDLKINQTETSLSRIALRVQAQPMLNTNNECIGIVGLFQDIEDAITDKTLLLDSERRFKAIFNQSFQFVGLLDAEGNLIEANETALDFGGITLESIKGLKFWDAPWFQYKQEGRLQLKKAIQAAGKGRLIRYETEIIGVGGSTLTIDLSIRPILDEKGAVMYLIPEGRDISDKREVHQQLIELNKELELKVENRTRELQQTNEDLESFAYSISHDLRAPLRAISGFSQIILEEYDQVLDEEGYRLLNIIIGNSQKMSILIDDLLLFSRTSRKEVVKTEVNTSRVFETVASEIKLGNKYVFPEIKHEGLPIVFADSGMFRQVIMNLLENAIKYSSKVNQPRIQLKCRALETEYEFCISDNGIGFDKNNAKGLFQVFQRLHSSKNFEGTGVGLSIVKKIIDKHGGKVWAEGVPNQGANFYFTLPKYYE